MHTIGRYVTLAAAAAILTSVPAIAAPSAADRKFMADAAADGMAEVALGKLAAEKASQKEVKDFAKMMVDDHTKANAELKSLAEKKAVKLPAEPKPAHKAVEARLARLSGAAFDKAYMAAMVKDHRKAVDMFTRQSNGAADDDLQAWATRTLPALKHHLEEAQERDRAVRAAK